MDNVQRKIVPNCIKTPNQLTSMYCIGQAPVTKTVGIVLNSYVGADLLAIALSFDLV
jgi:hypothetical protein